MLKLKAMLFWIVYICYYHTWNGFGDIRSLFGRPDLEKLLGPTKSLCWSIGLCYMDWFICYYHTWNMLGTSQIYLLGCTLGKLFSCGKCLSSSWNSLLGILLFCIVFLFLRDHPQNKSNHFWGRMGLGWYAGKPNSHSFANEVSVATALIFWFIVNWMN